MHNFTACIHRLIIVRGRSEESIAIRQPGNVHIAYVAAGTRCDSDEIQIGSYFDQINDSVIPDIVYVRLPDRGFPIDSKAAILDPPGGNTAANLNGSDDTDSPIGEQ